MADGTSAGINPVPFKITDPEYIPAQRYYDQAFFELERERLWPHVWQMACRLEEIPEVGDWVEYKILDKSVIVVRAKSGVKAFHNACRHRGVQLVGGRGSCEVRGFTCPFHGWRFNIDGENTFVFDRQIFSEEKLKPEDINLAPCRVELWGGCAFINFDDEAPSLRTSLGPVADKMEARRVDELRMEWWCATVLPTNWKLAMEAFMEGYHVMRTHPQLYTHRVHEMNPYGLDANDRAPPKKTTAREFIDKAVKALRANSVGMAGMTLESEVDIADGLRGMELPEDLPQAAGAFYTRLKDEIYKDGLARGLPVFDMNKVDTIQPFTPVEFMFPHYFLLPFFSAMSSYRIRPLTAETCYFEIWSLIPMADGDPRERVTAPTVLAYNSTEFPPIPQQDYSNLPAQQLGLHAGGFENMRLSNQKEGLISNYQRLIDGYLGGMNPERLARASQIVNSGFDSPILDIGF